MMKLLRGGEEMVTGGEALRPGSLSSNRACLSTGLKTSPLAGMGWTARANRDQRLADHPQPEIDDG